MELNTLIIFVVIVLVIQIALAVVGRRLRKKQKENNVLYKYDIKTPHDAWKLMGDQSIPEEDRKEIERIYNNERSEEDRLKD